VNKSLYIYNVPLFQMELSVTSYMPLIKSSLHPAYWMAQMTELLETAFWGGPVWCRLRLDFQLTLRQLVTIFAGITRLWRKLSELY